MGQFHAFSAPEGYFETIEEIKKNPKLIQSWYTSVLGIATKID